MKRPKNNEQGIALMIVLWILVLLTALATEFAYSMRTETNTTRNYKEDVESYYLAKAGINLAMAEILQEARFHSINDTQGFMVGKPLESEVKASEEEEEEEAAFYIVNRTDIPLGSGTVSYQISDENGKINLNTADRGMLIKVLRASGMEIGEERDIIADSILDWIDKDDNHRLNGAENSYYEGLTPP
ncbi:MAG: general secretion pathway protein GspK, partial [Nitrospinales bacterium]